MHTLFITVNVVSQSQQMQKKKKKREEKTRFENVDAGLIAIQTHTKGLFG